MQVILKLDGGERIAFYAGQYINILLDDGAKRSFSFATAAVSMRDRIELHIRRIPAGATRRTCSSACARAIACASRGRSARSSCARTRRSR